MSERDEGACRCGADVDEVHSPDCSDLIDPSTPTCACGHTYGGHSAEGCFACIGPPCDLSPREAVARELYAAFGRHETGVSWDDLGVVPRAMRDHFYYQADRTLLAVANYGSPDDLANICDDARWGMEV